MEVLESLTSPPVCWKLSMFRPDTLALPHTCSSDAPAFCSLYSKAASSPTDLGWAETGCCSYSTHRLLSESEEADTPEEMC